ncbi:MAG: hypothetical protein FJ102_02565 [Deltaproteobacteria bacterium]|nr:hypothetical protein [Deltaproteobacteria bacterium]
MTKKSVKKKSRLGLGTRALFAILPLVVILGGAEAYLRGSGWPKTDVNTQDFTHKDVYWVEAPNQNLEVTPHRETGGSFRVSTDANGLRFPLHTQQKPAGAYRVMALGCSTTYGWGVDDADSYPAKLDKILNETGHAVEVINGGQPGYSSFQGLWLWDKTLAKYGPDVVIFGYVVQDSRKVKYSDRSQAILQRNGDWLKSSLLHQLKSYLWLRERVNLARAEQKDLQPDIERVPPEEYAENIRAFKSRIDAVGAKMLLFGYPLERAGYTEGHRALLASAGKVLGVPHHDPQPEIERRTATDTLYFPQDRGHANALGNEAIAQGMAQFLVGQGLVP